MHTVGGNVSQDAGYQPIGEDDRKDMKHYIPDFLQACTLKGMLSLAV